MLSVWVVPHMYSESPVCVCVFIHVRRDCICSVKLVSWLVVISFQFQPDLSMSPLDKALQGLTNHGALAEQRLNQPPWAAKWSERIHLTHKHTHTHNTATKLFQHITCLCKKRERLKSPIKATSHIPCSAYCHTLCVQFVTFPLILSLFIYLGSPFPCSLFLQLSEIIKVHFCLISSKVSICA